MLAILHLERAAGPLASGAPLVEPLSEREVEVMRLVALGLLDRHPAPEHDRHAAQGR